MVNGKQVLGPGIFADQINGPSYGLGFTVTVSTWGGGGIGHIGPDLNTKNPTGTWTINQAAVLVAVQDGVRSAVSKPHELESWVPKIRNGPSQYTYWDHPGIGIDEVKDKFSGTWNFKITATNGVDSCELNFRVGITYDAKKRKGTATWR